MHRLKEFILVAHDILISALAVAALLAAIWLPFQLRGYELLDGRIDTDGMATLYAGGNSVACSYWHFTGYETFIRVYHAAEPRDDYQCPFLRKRGGEPFMMLFDE